MLGASKSIRSALMKHFHYALKVAGFQSVRALSEFKLLFFFFFFKYRIVDLLFYCWYFIGLFGIWILGEVGGLQ